MELLLKFGRHPLSKAFRMSDFSGGESEGAMNCQSCNASIDYKYLTNCGQCGRELNQATLSPPETAAKRPLVDGGNKAFTWKHRLLNFWYVITASFVGMISGATVLYFSAAIILIPLNGPETYPGENCARGMAIGWLSILSGAFLGIVGGTVFSVKNPICK